MPLYDFKCGRCDVVTEMLVKRDAAPACPSCGGETVRLVSAPLSPRIKVIERWPEEVKATRRKG